MIKQISVLSQEEARNRCSFRHSLKKKKTIVWKLGTKQEKFKITYQDISCLFPLNVDINNKNYTPTTKKKKKTISSKQKSILSSGYDSVIALCQTKQILENNQMDTYGWAMLSKGC